MTKGFLKAFVLLFFLSNASPAICQQGISDAELNEILSEAAVGTAFKEVVSQLQIGQWPTPNELYRLGFKKSNDTDYFISNRRSGIIKLSLLGLDRPNANKTATILWIPMESPRPFINNSIISSLIARCEKIQASTLSPNELVLKIDSDQIRVTNSNGLEVQSSYWSTITIDMNGRLQAREMNFILLPKR